MKVYKKVETGRKATKPMCTLFEKPCRATKNVRYTNEPKVNKKRNVKSHPCKMTVSKFKILKKRSR